VLCDGLQCNIDEKNEIMNKLHNEMGPAVVKTVTDTHKEILEDNRSGVCVMNLAWNFAEDHRATIKEVISRLLDVIKKKEKMLGTRRHRKKWKKEAD
jgi:hypothetical protein